MGYAGLLEMCIFKHGVFQNATLTVHLGYPQVALAFAVSRHPLYSIFQWKYGTQTSLSYFR